ncbi:hypothetical protein [Streptomyces sp. TRM68367]|uniref:hypothetical protein n=1 Tax=Streptomyces sp. TRM68367 TaxID=2758415 RepID=UPI00165A31F7|nr:hypothetical protein [Streptomyces sp. TRM68367]
MFGYSGGGGHHSSSSSGWGWLGAGAGLLGALGQGFSWAGAGEAAEVGIFVLAAGYSSCDVTTTPPPPPPPTAKTGLRQNPGTRPTGQPKGSQSLPQNGAKTAATGPSDTLPVVLQGAAPQVTDPTTGQPANNGTVLDNSDGTAVGPESRRPPACRSAAAGSG